MTFFTIAMQSLIALVFAAATLVLLARPRVAQSVLSPFPTGLWGRFIVAGLVLLPGLALGLSIAVPFFSFFAAVLAGVIALIVGGYANARGVRAIWPFSVGTVLASALIPLL